MVLAIEPMINLGKKEVYTEEMAGQYEPRMVNLLYILNMMCV